MSGASEIDIVLYFIVILVIAVIILAPTIINLAEIKRNFTSSPFVGIVSGEEPVIAFPTLEEAGSKCRYTVDFSTSLEYTGNMPEGGIQVIPIIGLKEPDDSSYEKRADVLFPDGTRDDKIAFDSENLKVDGVTFESAILSNFPPIKSSGSSSYSGDMKKFQSILLETQDEFNTANVNGRFVVSLVGVGESLTDQYIPFTQTCYAKFIVECGKSYTSAVVLKACEEGGPTTECKKIVEACDGSITIEVTRLDSDYCKQGKAAVAISAVNGDPTVLGERVTLTLWKKSDCTDKQILEGRKNSEILAECKDDFLGQHEAIGPITPSDNPCSGQ